MSKQNKIAIVGVACRFPGNIQSLADYWRVLKNGVDVVSEIPDSRWSKKIYGHPKRKTLGRSYSWAAGVLSKIDEFDAEFFGISRREAELMDPQQRLLLELTWEAFEEAGLRPAQVAGTQCGVFIGIGSNDYIQRKLDDLEALDGYCTTGNTASIGSNRISYIYDLRGPSMSIDTACSSSLVALHQACNSLHRGEATMAVAGGVNMLLHPLGFVGFSKASMLSPTGRCKTFDASGDGYVRAEGAGIVILKPLAQAEKDGDVIHAVIVASQTNCDGKTKGLTVPSTEAQAKLLKTIYQTAQIDANEIAYLEAHGTGTAVGDPLEAKALSLALGSLRRKDNPLLMGSAKTNLGHLEVASGMAGLLKTLLCLKHRAIPANLHFKTPNPAIHFKEWNLKVVERFTPLAKTDKPLFMGVNSFGFGGANAHVLLEEYHNPPVIVIPATPLIPPLFLSARKPSALTALAREYAELIALSDNYYAIAWSSFYHRQALDYGLAIFANDPIEIVQQLQLFTANETSPYLMTENQLPEISEVALVYSGNGCQWLGMGCVLFKENLIFRNTLKTIDIEWQHYAPFSIIGELFAHQESSRLLLTEVAQPLLFAFQVALTEMLLSLGLKATAVLGHSVGEVAAAWASGALNLKQAVQVIYERSFAQAKTQGSGKMSAIGLSAQAIAEKLTALNLTDSIVIAGINSPVAVTVSGDEAALKILEEQLLQENIFCKMLDLDYAFHSPAMDGIENQVLTQLANLKPNSTTTRRFISTVTGKALDGTELTADYWWQNIRLPVEFSAAVNTLLDENFRIFIEIGAHPVLQRYIEQSLQAKELTGKALAVVKRQEENVAQVTATVYKSYLLGAAIEEKLLFPVKGQFVSLPHYPWQRERYWSELSENGYGLIERQFENPLLGYRLKKHEFQWENALDTVLIPWLADHEVGGAVVYPASAYIEMALAASKSWTKATSFQIEELDISIPIVLDAEHLKMLHFTLTPSDGTFAIRSRDHLSHNASGRLLGVPLQKSTRLLAMSPALADAPKRLTGQQHYQLTKIVGLQYGKAFQTVDSVWVWAEQKIAWARLTLPKILAAEYADYVLHPALLDGCFQCLVDIFSDKIENGQRLAMIPIRIGKLRFYGDYGPPRWCKIEIKRYQRRSVVADFTVLDSDHNIVAVLNQVRFRSVNFVKGVEHYPATYTYINKLMPHTTTEPAPIPTFKSLAATVNSYLKKKEPLLRREQHFGEVLPLFDALVSAYCWEAVKVLLQGRTSATVNELVNLNGILDEQIELLLKILAIGVEDNTLNYQENKWRLLTDNEMPAPEAIWRTIAADYPEYLPELVLMAQCGLHLTGVLTGKVQPSAVLSPAKSSTQEHLYGSSRSWGVAGLCVAKVIETCVKHWPDNRRLRILCCGGGHTELTHNLLSLLPVALCDYVLLDTDENVVAHAQALFERLDFFSAFTLDIENVPKVLPEALKLAHFDIVIAANTLHKVNHLETALDNLRQFLVPGGMLIVQERASDRFSDISCGLDPKWWLYDEETGITSARLVGADTWARLLETQNFIETKTLIEPEVFDNLGIFVVLAKNALTPPTPIIVKPTQIWVLLLDESPQALSLYKHLQNGLKAANQTLIAIQATHEPQTAAENFYSFQREHPEQLLTLLTQIGDYQHLVHLDGWCSTEIKLDLQLASQRCLSAMQLLQAAETLTATPVISVWLITSGGAVYEEKVQEIAYPPKKSKNTFTPAQAALWGFGRVAMNEYPALNWHLVDIPICHSLSHTATLLTQEFLRADKETEVVITPTARHVLRMHRTHLKTPLPLAEKNAADVALDFKVAGSLNHLYWRLLEPSPPLEAHQIQIRPYAVGLNFRDVMYAMGMLPEEAVENGFAGASLGMELSGVVERVGKNVKNFKVGDEVISFAPASFSTRVITDTTATVHKPKAWTFEQATTIPSTFFTVYYALHYLARLQPGERILIHGAAGGIGLAAIQYAEYVGAEIFATAGTDEKRTFVKMMGADHVLDSRSMAFADDIMTITAGQGIDVVLNSLSGEAIWRNLSVLRPFGRFLELGKRDFYENSKIGLRPFRNNISYYGIDADQLLIERKTLAASLFQEMMQLFEEKFLKPLPFRVFQATQIIDAFRYMQQSRQIGKVVVSFAETAPLIAQAEEPLLQSALKLDSHASYLVSGGLGGFGLKTAQWLVKKGARHLILLGRTGVKTTEASLAIQNMETQGVTVYARAVDVCDLQQLSELFAQIAYCAPPLKGIIHAAAVIEDSLIKQLDELRLLNVLQPKIQGSWNLHRLTEKLKLDFFVLYSSMTTFLGNPGQANYVAANSYLESLAHYRRQKGLRGLYIAWGPIEDAGFLTRNKNVKETLEARIGSKAILSKTALFMLEKLILANSTGAAVIDFDWATIARFMPAAKSPKYEEQILRAKRLGTEEHQHENIKHLLAQLSSEEAVALVAQLLAQEVGQILRLPAEKVDKQKSVFDLGMDSLMGMELAIAIEDRFEVKLPLMALAEGATIGKLAAKIVEMLHSDNVVIDNEQDTIRALAMRHDVQVSEEMLGRLVDSIKPTGESDERAV